MNRLFLLLLPIFFFLVHCASPQNTKQDTRDLSQFECNQRVMAYLVKGGFGADEAGVRVECGEKNPRLSKWIEEDGDRRESTHRISGENFDALWKTIDSSGWRHVAKDCNNPKAKNGDPAYIIAIGDHALRVGLTCSGKTLPFPYDRIVNELDLRAAGFGQDL